MTLVKISEKGQIVIPAAFRKKWNLEGGSTIILTDDVFFFSDLSGIDEGKGLLQKLQKMREEEGDI